MNTTTLLRKSRKPRTRPEPSRRNQQIFIEYELGGKTQEELATKHKIKQCRVSQILRSVREWRSRVDPLLAGDLPGAQQKRLDAWLEHERLSLVEREAMRAFHREQRTITSRKEGDRDGKKYRETSEREQAASVQWLKAAMRATELKFKLQQERKWPSIDYDEQERERIAQDHWQRQRIAAEEQGRAPRSEYPWEVAQQWGQILGGEVLERQELAPGVVDLARRVIRMAEGMADEQRRAVGVSPLSDGEEEPVSPTIATCAAPQESSQGTPRHEVAETVAFKKTSAVGPNPAPSERRAGGALPGVHSLPVTSPFDGRLRYEASSQHGDTGVLTHPARQASGAAGSVAFEGELSGASYEVWRRANLERMVTARHLPQDVIERARQKLRELNGEIPTPPKPDPPQLPPITIYSMLDVYK